jgi:hypothetical protein
MSTLTTEARKPAASASVKEQAAAIMRPTTKAFSRHEQPAKFKPSGIVLLPRDGFSLENKFQGKLHRARIGLNVSDPAELAVGCRAVLESVLAQFRCSMTGLIYWSYAPMTFAPCGKPASMEVTSFGEVPPLL